MEWLKEDILFIEVQNLYSLKQLLEKYENIYCADHITIWNSDMTGDWLGYHLFANKGTYLLTLYDR